MEKKLFEKYEIEPQPRVEQFAMNLLNLDERGITILQERIKQLNGHIRAVMHPFFTEYENFTDQSKFNSSYQHTLDNVENAVNQESSSPLFIFEDEDHLEKTKEKIGDTKAGVFFVPTYPKNSTISAAEHIPGVNQFNYTTYIAIHRDFDYLIDMFRSLGVRSMTISGMWEEDCLKMLSENMRQVFLVDLSKNCLQYNKSMEDSQKDLKNKKLPGQVYAKETGKK